MKVHQYSMLCAPILSQEAAIEAQQEGLKACLEKLPYSPSYFTTAAAVHDLAAVLDYLGVEKANLFGVSYGSRMALAFLRDGQTSPIRWHLGTRAFRCAWTVWFLRTDKDGRSSPILHVDC